jgi:hypothetical protein
MLQGCGSPLVQTTLEVHQGIFPKVKAGRNLVEVFQDVVRSIEPIRSTAKVLTPGARACSIG